MSFVIIPARVLLGCHLFLNCIENDNKLLRKGIDVSKRGLKMNETVIYEDWATWDAGRKELPIMRQSDCICLGVHRS